MGFVWHDAKVKAGITFGSLNDVLIEEFDAEPVTVSVRMLKREVGE